MDEQLALAAEFPSTSEADWRKLVEAALKGASFEKRLVGQTYDGLRVEPLYPRAENAKPVAGRAPGAAWTIMQRVDHPDAKAANAQALRDLENGAGGLTLVFAGSLNANGYGLDASPETIATVLDGIDLDAGITIDFNLSPPTRNAVDHVRGAGESAQAFAGRGRPARQPQSDRRLCRRRRQARSRGAKCRKLCRRACAASPTKAFAGPSWSPTAASSTMPAARRRRNWPSRSPPRSIACARWKPAGVPLDAARGMIYFRLAADADEFLTIAKFRAIRKLWARVEEACGLTPKPTIVAAETAWRMLTRRDPDVNMLRTTIAVAAAGLGGADNIVALPHTAAIGLPDAFARRIARNTQLILLEESNLARVADPGRRLRRHRGFDRQALRAAWALFQAWDAAGGAWAALEQGMIQREVATVRSAREKAVARRKDALTGTTDYPNLREAPAKVLDVLPVEPPKEPRRRPPSSRWRASGWPNRSNACAMPPTAPEQDRIAAKVFLANLGKLSDFTARATFAKNFYEAGGIEALSNDGFKDHAGMLTAFKAMRRKACLPMLVRQGLRGGSGRRRQGALRRRRDRPSCRSRRRSRSGMAPGGGQNIRVHGLRRAFDLAGDAW